MTLYHELAALFGDATHRQRLMLAALVSAMLGFATYSCSWAGAVMGGFVPVKRTIITITRRAYPPLRDPREACSGAPVFINKLEATEQTKGDWTTWLTVRPAGDNYLVYCEKAGATEDMWKEGDLVRLYGGEVA